MQIKGGSLPEVRRQNRIKIKELIYKNAPITRTVVAERLGLTLPTITTSVIEMLADGILIEKEIPQLDPHNPQGGRKPQYLDISPNNAYVLGLEHGPYHTALCITDLRGEIIKSDVYPPASLNYDEMLRQTQQQIEKLISESEIEKEMLLGAAVGLPGFIEGEHGVIRSSARRNWNGKSFASDLENLLGIPVMIDNNVRLRAVGEELFSKQKRPDTFAYFFISKGIACPLMIGNDILSGKTAGAGEVGHMVIVPDGPVCPGCGNKGCLEAVAGENSIMDKCRFAIRDGKAPILSEICPDETSVNMKDVLEAQRAGDEIICAIIHKAVYYLALSLANVINLISPKAVIVDGYIMQNEINRKELVSMARKNLYGLNDREVSIEFIPFSKLSGAKGAAAVVVKRLFIEK